MNPVILRRFIKLAHPRLKAEARNFGSKLETQSSKLEDQKSSLGSARSKLEIAKLEELEARKYLARCNPTKHPLYLVQTIFVPNLEIKFIDRQDLFLEDTEGIWS